MSAPDDAMLHPRPLLRRPFESLDGEWEFALDPEATWSRPGDVPFDARINVPFAPETPASGIHAGGHFARCWYRRRVRFEHTPGATALLHFGAVDRRATVWVDGAPAGHHVGGYTSFAVDCGHLDGHVEIVVQADDDPGDLEAPRGKQDWRDTPHAIWYPRTTGIWRGVWLERVAQSRIADVRWIPDRATMTVTLDARLGKPPPGGRLLVRLSARGQLLVDDSIAVNGAGVERTFRVGDGGFDDLALQWTPRQPTLIEAEIALLDADGGVLDEVRSYTALRSLEVRDGRVLINGRPRLLRLALDQGYWPSSGATPPDAGALGRDLELTRALGFNGVRKHQKTEDPRYFALADRMGMIVWVEMPSAYRAGAASAANLIAEWTDVVRQYRGHPSVIAWVPFNESWAVPNLETDETQVALLQALAATAEALDGTRPVSVNDGWETIGGGIVGIHDYTQDPAVLRSRYGTSASIDEILTGRRFDGRLADLRREPAGGRAIVLSEFGGIALSDDTGGANWGYVRASSPEDLLDRYREQWRVVHDSEALAGACWTQLTDTYQEVNGLLRADRTPKVPLDDFRAATIGR